VPTHVDGATPDRHFPEVGMGKHHHHGDV
jgi:hypothetical protein